jgi:hypothetical protein
MLAQYRSTHVHLRRHRRGKKGNHRCYTTASETLKQRVPHFQASTLGDQSTQALTSQSIDFKIGLLVWLRSTSKKSQLKQAQKRNLKRLSNHQSNIIGVSDGHAPLGVGESKHVDSQERRKTGGLRSFVVEYRPSTNSVMMVYISREDKPHISEEQARVAIVSVVAVHIVIVILQVTFLIRIRRRRVVLFILGIVFDRRRHRQGCFVLLFNRK